VLQVLHARQGAMTAGDLAARFSHSWPTTTRHLGVLVDAGLVRVERDGRQRRYILQREHLGAILDLWLAAVGLHLEPPTGLDE
jgi:DNA-binding transcriptional ArsR family regulator